MEIPCNRWLRKAYIELLAIKRIVLLYPKSTLLCSLLLLSLILVVGVWGVTHVEQTEVASARDRATIIALDARVWVQQLLANAISPVRLTAALVAINPEWTAAKSLFEGLAPMMHAQAPPGSLRVIQLVPHGRISACYPLAGNEGAMQLDLFSSPTNRDGALKTVMDRKLTLVGPTKFVQGGVGFIVREPIFVANISADEDFGLASNVSISCGPPCAYNATTRTQLWGFASALVDLAAMLQANGSKLGTLERLGYRYQLTTKATDITAARDPVAASAIAPQDPIEVSIDVPNNEWVLRVAPEQGWSSKWYGGILAGVILLALATALLLFAALLSWRRHQMLLEALLPAQILEDLQHEDFATPMYKCPRIRQTEAPADLLLNMMGDLLMGQPPKLPDVVFIRTALLRNLDLYTPLNVRSQIKAADLDSEVAHALMQQLVGGRRNSYSISRQLTGQCGGGSSSGGNDVKPPDPVSRTSYDVGTLSGALAFVLSPEALSGDSALPVPKRVSMPYSIAGGCRRGSGGGDVGLVGGTPLTSDNRPQPIVCQSSTNLFPLLVRGGPLLTSAGSTTFASLAEVAKAPPMGSCVGDLGGGGGCGEEEEAADGGGPTSGAPTVAAGGAGFGGGSVGGGPKTMSGSDTPTVITPPPPLAILQPRRQMSAAAAAAACAPGSAAFSALLRSAVECEDTFGSLIAASPLLQQSSPQQQQQHGGLSLQWLQNSQRRPPSAKANGGGGLSSVCATCGSPVPPPPPPPPPQQHLPPPPAPTEVTYNWFHGSGSGTKLMAAARRLRGVGTGGAAGDAANKPPRQQGSISVSGAIVSSSNGGGGGGPLRPCSRLALALALSPRERLPSQPSHSRAPPLLALQPPGSLGASHCAAVTYTNSGSSCGAVVMAATPAAADAAAPPPPLLVDVRRSSVADDLDSQSGAKTPVMVMGAPGGEAAAETEIETEAREVVRAVAEADVSCCVRPPPPLVQEVERVLADVDGWHFDVWALRDASGGHALSALGFFLIQREGLLAKFHIKPVVLARLLRRLEAGYLDNPYHNAVHAADVLQSLHVLLHGAQLHVHYLDQLGLLAAYFSAIIHDLGHPGLTGDFLAASSHCLALRYNDRSPLENHHCAAAFELMRRLPELDVTKGLSQADRATFRKLVIELVLATDMKQHFSILSHFNTVHRLTAYSQMQQQLQQQQQQLQQQQQYTHLHQPTLLASGGGGGGNSGAGGNSFLTSSGARGLIRHATSNGHMVPGRLGAPPAASNGNGNCTGNGSGPSPGAQEVLVMDGAALADASSVTGMTGAAAAAVATAPHPVDDTERLLSLQLALKCADIGNLGRGVECYKRWVAALEEEFFRQGDQERELGLPISPLSDRAKQGVSKSQTGFFDFVALPLVHAMAAAFPGAQPLLRAFLANYNLWKCADASAPPDSTSSSPHQQQQQQQQMPVSTVSASVEHAALTMRPSSVIRQDVFLSERTDGDTDGEDPSRRQSPSCLTSPSLLPCPNRSSSRSSNSSGASSHLLQQQQQPSMQPALHQPLRQNVGVKAGCGGAES